MTAYALDYQSPTAMDGARCQAAGIPGVLRYLYNLTVAELQDLWSHGIAVAPIFEHLTTDYQGGYAAGVANGRSAREKATSLGFPTSTIIYCAVDTRLIQPALIATAVDYFRGFWDGAGASRPYGESAFIDACVAAGLTDLGWCPATWDTTDSPYLALIQLVYEQNPYPSTDQNRIMAANWGGYLPGGDDVTIDDFANAIANNTVVTITDPQTGQPMKAGFRDVMNNAWKVQIVDEVGKQIVGSQAVIIAEIHKVPGGGAAAPLKVTLSGTAVSS